MSENNCLNQTSKLFNVGSTAEKATTNIPLRVREDQNGRTAAWCQNYNHDTAVMALFHARAGETTQAKRSSIYFGAVPDDHTDIPSYAQRGVISLNNDETTGMTFGVGVSTQDFEYRVAGTGTLLKKILGTGEQTIPLQPAFLSYLSADATNVTGDNTTYTIICNTEVFDQNSNYNNTNGIFTAPVTGRYQFNVSVYLQGIDSANQDDFWCILTTSNRTYRLLTSSVDLWETSGNSLSFTGSTMADMDASDTASFSITVAGTSKVVDVDGDANGRTYFSGALLC